MINLRFFLCNIILKRRLVLMTLSTYSTNFIS